MAKIDRQRIKHGFDALMKYYEDQGIKPKFFYKRIEENGVKNVPMITVCALSRTWDEARGIAVCSHKDNPDKLVGKYIALKKAHDAIHRSNSLLNVKFFSHPSACKTLLKAGMGMTEEYLVRHPVTLEQVVPQSGGDHAQAQGS